MKNKWDGLHSLYSKQDWIDKPNIFAEEVLQYFPDSGYILSLGDGQGQDSRFFSEKGYKVLATDISEDALDINKQKLKESGIENVSIQKLDLKEKFPFKNNIFDIVYSHLSIHYFDYNITSKIFNEIRRVLKPNGIIAVFTNTTNDPEYNTGKKLEDEFFEIDGVTKRFFSIKSMSEFTKDFKKILIDDKGRTYKDEAKGVHNLIRFVGKKPKTK